ncbi:MAG TPA: CHAT domain-containing protein [Actinocrinis sp.]|uniref:CHAT domain-containing protein n=1 Tax=Actinocrinis sp. TaxID=1920516 RepID=UPI002DDCD11D|nr:CHAT domain-containing protein [Actinocrinis sp.]HEV2344846.1 CHAT domain-containing protein [Actinocrinis sp.]
MTEPADPPDPDPLPLGATPLGTASADPARAQAVSEARRLHRLGVETTARGEPEVAQRHLRRALRLLGVQIGRLAQPSGESASPAAPSPDMALAADILISLAHAEAERGRTSLGFALLLRAEPLVEPAKRGTLYGQLGLLLLRIGKPREAIARFDAAIGLIDARRQPIELARALLNRGAAKIEGGVFATARPDLERCAALARAEGRPLLAAKAAHNLGCCDLAVGDVPAALRTIGEAADGAAAYSPSWRPVVLVDIARALLLAGLAADAAAELDGAIELFRRQRVSHHRADAEMVRAEASLLMGDVDAARDWARRARAGFRRRGNETAAAAAALIELHALFEGPFRAEKRRGALSPRTLAARAFRLAARLREMGLRDDAVAAHLLGVRALIAARDVAGAVAQLRSLPRLRAFAPLNIRLLRYLTLAELAVASGERGRALRTLRHGLAELARHRAQLGSIDLQTGTAALGVELSARGLALSLDGGDTSKIFTWSELSRAQSLRITPVRPPADPDVALAVAELRQLESNRRDAIMAGRVADSASDGRIAALKRRVRQAAWPTQGAGVVGRVPTLAATTAELDAAGQAMISIFRRDAGLRALVVAGGRRRVLALGDAARTYETARRLRADITALVGRLLPSRMEKALAEAINAHAGQLAADLLPDGVTDLVGCRELVLVPCGPLAALPWQLLPPLRGRPLCVAPSAANWLAARQVVGSVAPALDKVSAAAGRAVLIGGPGLRESARELASVASQYPDAIVLQGADATVAATLRALDGAPLAHLAVHGDHEPENALFSRLDLADGPLMAYDLLHLNAPPRLAVLSACEVGRAATRPGDEPLGVVTTLLHLGSATVIAAVAPVSDSVTAEVMTAYHRHLNAGARPAQALAAATTSNPLAVFNCYGAG